ncbi:MAG TPA: Rieske (2Fe-2S) protein [Actinomycetota bacterium]|nr:Rieske (2Fe-2S) protein [Actinomycetota bacterium]
MTLQDDRAGRLRRGTLMNRRDYLKMLVLASGGLLVGTAGLASGIFRRHGGAGGPARRVAGRIGAVEMVTFSYPGDDDPVIGLRLNDGELVAFSSVCTHLSCAVLWRREEGVLECPCHKGIFDERTGEVVAGPPPRPLPKVRLEERSDGVWAVGAEH